MSAAADPWQTRVEDSMATLLPQVTGPVPSACP